VRQRQQIFQFSRFKGEFYNLVKTNASLTKV
jgi:hypothetical protein